MTAKDSSKFAVTLETLAVKAFGDMDPNARTRLIRDRFIAGHPNCALLRYLDSVLPETPIRDIVDICIVWESHDDTDDRRVVKPMPEKARPVYAVNELTLMPTEQVVADVAAGSLRVGHDFFLHREVIFRCHLSNQGWRVSSAFLITGESGGHRNVHRFRDYIDHECGYFDLAVFTTFAEVVTVGVASPSVWRPRPT